MLVAHTPKVVITGASSGIGRATAVTLHAAGWDVVAIARRGDELERLADELGHERIETVTLDVRDGDAVRRLRAVVGVPDALVNSAGGARGLERADAAQWDDWQWMIETNVLGLVRLTHLFLPDMVARGSGTIVNVGSVAGEFPYPGGNVYGATKAFVRQFTLNLRADLAGTGVRVTDVEPGMVGNTDFSRARFGGDEARAQAVYEGMTPLRPEDVAEVIAFVLSRPAHVVINTISLMPSDQGFGPFHVVRRSEDVRASS